ncbi:MAG: LysM peptidoglycan-binding domain-containing protein [Anaerolineales bacterium]
MTSEIQNSPTKICPTCGTRIAEDATRCLVCGAELASRKKTTRPEKAVEGSRLPRITLGLPALLGFIALLIIVGALVFYFAFRSNSSSSVENTITPTQTSTATITVTSTPSTPTSTFTPEPSPTPLVYTVKLGDSCGGIAFSFGVSIQSIVLLNNLPADCSTLYEGQRLLIPQPTPTATSLPTSTFSPAEATEAACEKIEYTVQENDTLSSISLNYNIPVEAIREYNGLVSDVVMFNQNLVIPLCRRNATPGPTPTPTLPPPYPAASLLLPQDGAPFNPGIDSISLQWASVGALRENEAYAVSIEDITEGEGRKLTDYVTDSKFNVPNSFLVNDSLPHVIRWWVTPVRQTGTDDDGNPIWESAGAVSETRVFTWIGIVTEATPVP